MKRLRMEPQPREAFSQNEQLLFVEGDVSQLNPDCMANDQAELLPYGQEWEVSRERIKIGELCRDGSCVF